MKRQWLHDLAKIGAGLAAAEFIILWWFSMQSTMPKVFLGLPLSDEMIIPAMLVNFFIFLMLVHYGWHIGKIPHIKERTYLVAAGAIFTVVAGAHALRAVYAGDVIIFGWEAPLLVSWIGAAVAAYLAYASFYFAGRLKR